jgi:protein TonB
MKGSLFKINDFDDLVFECRNKEYGAYQLRKKYLSALLMGILVALLIGCGAVIIPFLTKRPVDKLVYGGGNRFVSVQMDILEPPREDFYIPSAPSAPNRPEMAEIEETVKYSPPEVVDTIMPFEPTLATIDEAIAIQDDAPLDIIGSGFGDDIFDGYGFGGGDYGDPLFIVETMPSFRGGDINKFRIWVQNKINYPREAIEKNIEGRVYLTFIIETDGSVSNVTLIKGVDPLIDNVAVQAIQESPRWSPGRQRGQPVRVRYSFAINFAI